MAQNANKTEKLSKLQEAVGKFTVIDTHWWFIPSFYGVCWMIQTLEAAQLESIHLKKKKKDLKIYVVLEK